MGTKFAIPKNVNLVVVCVRMVLQISHFSTYIVILRRGKKKEWSRGEKEKGDEKEEEKEGEEEEEENSPLVSTE